MGLEEPRPAGWQEEWANVPGMPVTEQEKFEIERRVCWWKIAVDSVDDVLLSELALDYNKAIRQLVKVAGLDWGRVSERIVWYKELYEGRR